MTMNTKSLILSFDCLKNINLHQKDQVALIYYYYKHDKYFLVNMPGVKFTEMVSLKLLLWQLYLYCKH